MKDILIDLSKEQFIAIINESATSPIDHSQVVLTNEPIADVDPLQYGKTANIVIAPAPSSKYVGSQRVAIKTFIGEKLSKLTGGFVAVTSNEVTTAEVLDILAVQRGVLIDNTTKATITWTEEVGTFTIPDGNHFAINGDFVLTLKRTAPKLATLMTQPNVGRLHTKLPNTETVPMAAQLKTASTYGINTDPLFDTLNKYADPTISSSLAAELKKLLPSTMTDLADHLEGLPCTVKVTTDFPYADQTKTIALQVTLPDGGLLLFHASKMVEE